MRFFSNIFYIKTKTHFKLGAGLNHAMLTAQLAPALTKSYQQKMLQWESMQKSQFLGKFSFFYFILN